MHFRNILKKYIINNIGYKILAVVFSFLLWLVILNTTDPDYTRTISNIPVQILNENMILDGTHVYTISSGKNTNVVVTGKKSIVSTLNADDFLVTADFAELSITNAVPIKVELTGDKLRYSGQITYSAKDTSMLINLENMTSRQLQVDLEYRGEPEEDIVIDEANISPKKVTLNAPESISDSADKIVVTTNYAGITSDVTQTLTPVILTASGEVIEQGGNVSLEDTEISVEFKVSNKKDVQILANTSGTVAEGYVFDGLELSQDTISVKGPKDAIRSLNRIVIPGEAVKLSGAKEDFNVEIDVSPFLPENVIVYGESSMVTVTVKVREAQTTAPPETQTESGEEETEIQTQEETTK